MNQSGIIVVRNFVECCMYVLRYTIERSTGCLLQIGQVERPFGSRVVVDEATVLELAEGMRDLEW